MNESILNTDIQEFIDKNVAIDIPSLLLRKPIFNTVSNKELAQQIRSKKKCEKKLPTWFTTPQIYFPKHLSIEQCSSEISARYKSEIIDGKSLLDLTGGFGVDSYFFAQKTERVVHCEQDPELSQIARHNYKILNLQNVKTIHGDALKFLNRNKTQWDWIYADPSRRNDLKGKVFKLEDCHPNIPANLNLLLKKANKILIKTSPMLDLTAGISSLRFVKEIHIVAVNHEVKELLWVIEKGFQKEALIKTVNLIKESKQEFSFFRSEERFTEPKTSKPLTYLYEPNAAIMKSGGFNRLTTDFGINKLHQNTHLYTSNTLLEFPGRRYKIHKALNYNTKSIKNLGIKKANIKVRNFPENVAQLKKKYRIRDGGDVYLFFCKTSDEKNSMIKCSKIDH